MMKKIFIFLLALCSIGVYGDTKKVAILETVDKEGNVSYALKLMVRSSLSTAIADTPGYEAYDRVDVASILGEHEFQRTGLIREDDIKRLGEMTGAAYILVAEVAYLNETTIIILSKFLNVETAKIESSSNVYSSTSIEDLDKNCKVLAEKLLKQNSETGAVKSEISYDGGHYVGEILNGKPHGKGKLSFSSDDNRVSYEGDWVEGEKHGQGTMIWTNGNKYVGSWVSGSMSGQGTYYWSEGSKYIGEIKNDRREGRGTLYGSDGSKYIGNWRDDNMNGQGTFYFEPNDSRGRMSYDGNWINSTMQGNGTLITKQGDKYVGNWEDGLPNGEMTVFWSDGTKWEGNWLYGKRSGENTTYYSNGDKFVGIYRDGKLNGEATRYTVDGDEVVANFVDDKEEGSAFSYLSDGGWAEFHFKNGLHEGTITGYWKSGKIRLKGFYVNDKKEGEWVNYDSNGKVISIDVYKDGTLVKTKRK